jgi:hypothetical protein
MQLPSPSHRFALLSTDDVSLTLGTKRKRSPPVSLSMDSHVGNGSVTGDRADKRLTCDRCSMTFKEIKRLNRHRREVCLVGERLRCDYAGCLVTFKAPRHKAAHVKKQHETPVAGDLEKSGPVHQEARPGPTLPAPPEPYESPFAVVTPQVPTISAPEMIHSPPSLTGDENLSTPSEVNTCGSPPRPYVDLHVQLAEVEAASPRARVQAIIASIWNIDVDKLSNIRRDIIFEFGGSNRRAPAVDYFNPERRHHHFSLSYNGRGTHAGSSDLRGYFSSGLLNSVP